MGMRAHLSQRHSGPGSASRTYLAKVQSQLNWIFEKEIWKWIRRMSPTGTHLVPLFDGQKRGRGFQPYSQASPYFGSSARWPAPASLTDPAERAGEAAT